MLADHPGQWDRYLTWAIRKRSRFGELAKLVKKLTHSSSEIKLIPYDEAYQPGFEDMERRVPNITKVSRLGYAPKIKLNGKSLRA